MGGQSQTSGHQPIASQGSDPLPERLLLPWARSGNPNGTLYPHQPCAHLTPGRTHGLAPPSPAVSRMLGKRPGSLEPLGNSSHRAGGRASYLTEVRKSLKVVFCCAFFFLPCLLQTLAEKQ